MDAQPAITIEVVTDEPALRAIHERLLTPNFPASGLVDADDLIALVDADVDGRGGLVPRARHTPSRE